MMHLQQKTFFHTMCCISQVLDTIQKSLVVICGLFERVFSFTAAKSFSAFSKLLYISDLNCRKEVSSFSGI